MLRNVLSRSVINQCVLFQQTVPPLSNICQLDWNIHSTVILIAFPTIIRLGQNYLPWANALAYCSTEKVLKQRPQIFCYRFVTCFNDKKDKSTAVQFFTENNRHCIFFRLLSTLSKLVRSTFIQKVFMFFCQSSVSQHVPHYGNVF